jgi:hypothetical protein
LSEIFTVSISQETQSISAAGFGVPLILGATVPIGGTWTERLRFYASMAEVGDDFLAGDPEYDAAAAAFSPDIKPARIAIARREAAVAKVQTLTLAADLVADNTLSMTVNGETVEETYASSHQATMGALATAIAAIDGVASAVLSSTPYRVITVTATAGRTLTLGPVTITGGAGQTTGAIATSEAGRTISDDLTAIQTESDAWYALQLAAPTDADILTAAAWIEPRQKIFLVVLDAAGVIASTTTDVAAVLDALGYNRTGYVYHDDAGTFPDAAWLGRCLPLDPGTETWAFKTLTGVTAVAMTTTEVTNAESKHCNTYRTLGGVDVTLQGYMASGRFIDQVRGVDALQARIEEAVFGLLVRVPKVPFTDAGATLVEAEVRKVLFSDEFSKPEGGLIVRDSIVITVPKVKDISTNNRALRRLPGLTFSGDFQGAIHGGGISGTLSV